MHTQTLSPVLICTASLLLATTPHAYAQKSPFFESLKPALNEKCPQSPATTLLYFASEQCPEAQSITPKLLSWYSKKKSNEAEVVFISNDPSELSMRNHFFSQKMPWPSLKYNARTYSAIRKFSTGATLLIAIDAQGKLLGEIPAQLPDEEFNIKIASYTKTPERTETVNILSSSLASSFANPTQQPSMTSHLIQAIDLLQTLQKPK
jgi:hypothetical protein